MNTKELIKKRITTQAIVSTINNHQYDKLGDLLADIEWSNIEPGEIIRCSALRKFTKAIVDKEVRHDVMHFLEVYAENYFSDGAEELVLEDFHAQGVRIMPDARRREAAVYLSKFRAELNAQIQQLNTMEDYSGERFKNQEKRIKELEKQVKELQENKKQLEIKLDTWEHPSRYEHYIPDELNSDVFTIIMKYLCSRQLAIGMRDNTVYGNFIQCYHWYGSKALFGYFVDRLSYELELRDSGGRIQWKLFKPVIHNYDELIKEARNTVSEYTNNPQIRKPEKADVIEEAIKKANKKEDTNN